MKRLTVGQAAACETATHPRCRCRCGGELHGACRAGDPALRPAGDPHLELPGQLNLFDLTVEEPCSN